MASSESDGRLSAFLKSGVYRLDEADAYFIDSVRVMNRFYTRFRVSAATYYSRFFPSSKFSSENSNNSSKKSKKRKRREKEKVRLQALNPREQLAERRHQEVRPALLKAHEALLGASQLLEILKNLRDNVEKNNGESISRESELDLVELGSVWQAPFYEIVLNYDEDEPAADSAGVACRRVVPVFDNLVSNERSDDIEAEILDRKYILPKKSCFLMLNLTMASIL